MIGINISGAEFGSGTRYGYDYHYPDYNELGYYADKGVVLVRLPFTWERMQPTLGGALSGEELARLKTTISNAHALGMEVVIDLHNYGRYGGNTIGSASVSHAQFADFWAKLSSALKGMPGLAGYGIMNEPHDMGGAGIWKTAAQAAVNAIRTVDMQTAIYVNGDNWSTAAHWLSSNANFIINDPANNLYYEAHQYFDRYNQGFYNGSYDQEGAYPDIGVDRLKPFADWLKANNLKGFIGEFGAPGNDPRWLEVTDRFIKAMNAAGIEGTAWGGGFWWPADYPLRIGGGGVPDSPVMALYQKYFEPSVADPVPVPEPVVGGINGTAGNDVLNGTAGADQMDGREGNDQLNGSAGADSLQGGSGIDTVSYAASGGPVDVDLTRALQNSWDAAGDQLAGIEHLTGTAFNDRLAGDGQANVLNGGGGYDLLIGRGGADRLDGSYGLDAASYAASSAGVNIDLTRATQQGGDAQGDVLVSIEEVIGSAFADVLRGSTGKDTLRGGAGNDELEGRAGADALHGDGGIDTATYAASTSAVNIDLKRATQFGGHAEGDSLTGIENLVGSSYRDTLVGDAVANWLSGGSENDLLNGGGGGDRLTGGAGNDRFVFDSLANAKGDVVTDYSRWNDKLDFSQIDANAGADGNQGFSWIGTKAFTGVAGQLRSYQSGGNTYVAGDVNGDGIADVIVELTGSISLGSTNFYL